jgi:anti-sigma-K factor RskA
MSPLPEDTRTTTPQEVTINLVEAPKALPPIDYNKLKAMFQSRKFWVLIAAIVAIAAGYFTQGITEWQAIQALVAALGLYSTGVAIEDNGTNQRG